MLCGAYAVEKRCGENGCRKPKEEISDGHSDVACHGESGRSAQMLGLFERWSHWDCRLLGSESGKKEKCLVRASATRNAKNEVAIILAATGLSPISIMSSRFMQVVAHVSMFVLYKAE